MLPFNQQFMTYLFRILSVAQIVLGTEDKMKSTSTVVGTQDDVESNKCGNLLFKIGFIKGKHISVIENNREN